MRPPASARQVARLEKALKSGNYDVVAGATTEAAEGDAMATE
mgnify:CR=1 FL=1